MSQPRICPSCSCIFHQDFVCTTCGAEKLYDETIRVLKEQLAASQAREQQLREALEVCKKEMQGDKWDALYIDGVLANK